MMEGSSEKNEPAIFHLYIYSDACATMFGVAVPFFSCDLDGEQ